MVPEEASRVMRERLEAMGHWVMMAPLLSISFEQSDIDLEGVQAIVATSRNAIRALETHPDKARITALPILAVGAGTGAAARAAGFSVLAEGKGGGADLAQLIVRVLDPQKGALLHICGDVVAYNLKAALVPKGVSVRRAVLYRSHTADALPDRVVQALRSGELDAVLLMSPRTAEVWERLVKQAGLASEAKALIHLCLSEAVARPARQLGAGIIRVAVQPNSEEMLALAGQLASSAAR